MIEDHGLTENELEPSSRSPLMIDWEIVFSDSCSLTDVELRSASPSTGAASTRRSARSMEMRASDCDRFLLAIRSRLNYVITFVRPDRPSLKSDTRIMIPHGTPESTEESDVSAMRGAPGAAVGSEIDPELMRVIAAWPELPIELRQQIVALANQGND